MTQETEKKNSDVGSPSAARSVRRIVRAGGYVPDPQREARLRRVTRARNLLLRDLGAEPSKAQTALAANAAIFCVWLEDKAEGLLSGRGAGTAEYLAVSRQLTQTLGALGIQRKPRDVMTIDRYLKEAVDDSAGHTTKSAD
jgi:hypothetical protein